MYRYNPFFIKLYGGSTQQEMDNTDKLITSEMLIENFLLIRHWPWDSHKYDEALDILKNKDISHIPYDIAKKLATIIANQDGELIMNFLNRGTYTDKFKCDKDIVLTALNSAPHALEYVCEELQEDRDVVLKALNLDGNSIQGLSEDSIFRNDEEMAITAVTNSSESLQYFSDEIKDNEKVVDIALNDYQVESDDPDWIDYGGYALQYASERLKNKEEFVVKAIKSLAKECFKTCPITQVFMKDPVIAQDGRTYERQAITEWLRNNRTSPMTRQPMSINRLKPDLIQQHCNDAIKQMIGEQIIHKFSEETIDEIVDSVQ